MQSKTIYNSTDSLFLGDTSDSHLFYVLPPRKGEAKASSELRSPGNIPLCPGLATVMKSAVSQQNQLTKLKVQEANSQKILAQKQAAADALMSKVNKLLVGNTQLNSWV